MFGIILEFSRENQQNPNCYATEWTKNQMFDC